MISLQLNKQRRDYTLPLLSIAPFILSLIYFISLRNKAEQDQVLQIMVLGLLLINVITYFFPLKLHTFVRFSIGILVCGLLNRNIYLLVLFNSIPILASVSSQLLNLIYSYFVNARYTYPKGDHSRKRSGLKTKLLYGLVFAGEMALHALISTTLLHYVSASWTWFLTGGLVLPYTLLALHLVFKKK